MTSIKRSMSVLVLLLLSVVLAGCGGDKKTAEEQERVAEQLHEVSLNVNMIENPSFEKWKGNIPVGWKLEVFTGSGRIPTMNGKSAEEKKSGKYSCYIRGLFNTDQWLVLVQRHSVLPGYRLTFSAEIMTQRIKRNKGQGDMANLYVRFYDKDGNRTNDRYETDADTRHRWGDSDWFRDGRKILVPDDAYSVELGLVNLKTGYVYFDDVELILREPPDWEKIETKYITFYYLKGFPFPDGAVEKTAERIEGYARKMNIKLDRKIKYYYYHSEEHFTRIIGAANYRQRALWKDKELHTIDPDENNQLIHLLFIEYGKPPDGLARGLVFTMQRSMFGRDIHVAAKELLLVKKIPALFRVITTKEIVEVGTSITIPAWASFCKYLIDRHGPEKFMKLYEKANGVEEAEALNAIFNEVYNENFDVLDRAWRLYILRYQPAEVGDTL